MNIDTKGRLEEIVNQKRGIEQYVAKEFLDRIENDELTTFLNTLQASGCSSGLISGLIYYYQTHEFYDTYYYEIEELREEYYLDNGTQPEINGDLKNFFAWFSFEITADRMISELGME